MLVHRIGHCARLLSHQLTLLLGGTAGCIVAARLAEADPNLTILVIERGANNRDVPSVVTPAFYLQNLLPTSKTAIFYKGNKAEQLAGREPIVPSGGTLGGGSSINFMMYTRAQRSDFESWKTPGWSADELVPFLKKVRDQWECICSID
jgi:alcohol oxidase